MTPRRSFLLLLGLVLVPLFVSALVVAFQVDDAEYYPTGDIAQTELRTRDIGHHPVVTGLYSRDGWSHPGPALFYLLFLPYRLSGSSLVGLIVGALLINGAAIAGMALIARRRGGTPLLLVTLVGCGLLVHSLGADYVRDPWNPYIAVLPYGLLVFLVWSMTCGDTWALPVATAVATFCAQTHIGYVPMALPLLVWGAAWLVVRAGRAAGERRDLARAGLLSGAILAVMWLPTVVEQFLHSPGNLTKIVDYFSDEKNGVHTLGDGYRIVFGQFGLTPPWVTGARRFIPLSPEPELLRAAPVPVFLLAFALSALLLWRRREHVEHGGWRLAATVGLAVGLGVLAVARTIGPVFEYRLGWTWLLGMMVALVTAWTIWMLASQRWPRAGAPGLVSVAVAALATLAVVNCVTVVRADPLKDLSGAPMRAQSQILRGMLPSIMSALPDTDGDVIVRSADPRGGYYGPGLILQLERRGVAVRVEPPYLDRRPDTQRPVRAVVTFAANETLDAMLARPGPAPVAYRGKLPRRERAGLARRLTELDAAHDAGTIDDLGWYSERIDVSKQLGEAVAAFVGPDEGP